MELKIDKSKAPSLNGVLNISYDRAQEIMAFVEILYYELSDPTRVDKPLSKYYSRLAEYCINIEEYTFGMHNLLFNIARTGAPADSKQFTN